MNKKIKLFVIYFPVILIAGQVMVNWLYFINEPLYLKLGFYLNMMFGTNGLTAAFLVAFTFMFKFCSISRWAAFGQLAFAVNYTIVKQDNLYNIWFQIIVGTIAVLITFRHYIAKFPMCRVALFVSFFESIVSKRSCEKGVEHWRGNIIKHYHATNSHNRR